MLNILNQPVCSERCDITACPNHPRYLFHLNDSRKNRFIINGKIVETDNEAYSLKGISPYCVYKKDGTINYNSPAVCCNHVDMENRDGEGRAFIAEDTDGDDCLHCGNCVWRERIERAISAYKKSFEAFGKDFLLAQVVFDHVYYDMEYLECDMSGLNRPCCIYNKESSEKREAMEQENREAEDWAWERSQPDYDPFNDSHFDYVDDEGCGYTFDGDSYDLGEIPCSHFQDRSIYNNIMPQSKLIEQLYMEPEYAPYRKICETEAKKIKSSKKIWNVTSFNMRYSAIPIPNSTIASASKESEETNSKDIKSEDAESEEENFEDYVIKDENDLPF